MSDIHMNRLKLMPKQLAKRQLRRSPNVKLRKRRNVNVWKQNVKLKLNANASKLKRKKLNDRPKKLKQKKLQRRQRCVFVDFCFNRVLSAILF